MYEDKIREELFTKIRRYYEVICQIADNDNGKTLIDNEEYYGLCDEEFDLAEDISNLWFDTKYTPLTNLSVDEIVDLKYFPHMLEQYDIVVADIEKYLDAKLVELKEAMRQRLEKIKPLHLPFYLPRNLYYRYRETVTCYVYGAFNATCTLCRAIVEGVAKKYINDRGYGRLLKGKKTGKNKCIAEILEMVGAPRESISIYKKITNKADSILHEIHKEGATEESSLETLNLLQLFIKKFPKTL